MPCAFSHSVVLMFLMMMGLLNTVAFATDKTASQNSSLTPLVLVMDLPIPPDVWHKILSGMDPVSLEALSLTCRTLNKLVRQLPRPPLEIVRRMPIANIQRGMWIYKDLLLCIRVGDISQQFGLQLVFIDTSTQNLRKDPQDDSLFSRLVQTAQQGGFARLPEFEEYESKYENTALDPFCGSNGKGAGNHFRMGEGFYVLDREEKKSSLLIAIDRNGRREQQQPILTTKKGHWLHEVVTTGDYIYANDVKGNTIVVSKGKKNKKGTLENLQLKEPITVGANPRPPTVLGDFLFVSNFGSHNLSVISIESSNVVATIRVGFKPKRAIALDQYIYVLSAGNTYNDGKLAVIHGVTHRIETTLNIGRGALSICSKGRYIYVSRRIDNVNGEIIVIDTKNYSSSHPS